MLLSIPLNEKDFPTLFSMYDENDEGNTRGCVEVFTDRLKDTIDELILDGEDASSVRKELELLEKYDSDSRYEDYIEI